jgi:hypothetical protein
MIRAIVVLFFALICAALGNVALSHGMRQVGALETDQFRSLIRYFALAVFNPWVIVGMIMENVGQRSAHPRRSGERI